MQVLYTKNQDPQLKFSDALKAYRDGLRHSYELYLFSLAIFLKVAEHAKKDYAKKAKKLRPSKEDLAFLPKLYDNDIAQFLANNKALEKYFNAYGVLPNIKEDDVAKFYRDFRRQEAHKKYIAQKDSQISDHRNVLLEMYKFLASHELFNENMEDHYLSWTDDKSLVVGAIKKTIKALPGEEMFFKEYLPGTEATVDFGERLLKKDNDEDMELLAIIEPTLKNWDAERVAVIDMILLKMAVCELTECSTIPTKVTLNEFVEISKMYSTDKSKDFINGILDRLMKKLEKEGKINKEGRGLLN